MHESIVHFKAVFGKEAFLVEAMLEVALFDTGGIM